MNTFNLLSSVVRGKWLIDPVFAMSQGAIIANILNPGAQFVAEPRKKAAAYATNPKSAAGVRYSYSSGFSGIPLNSVAVIRISGALLKEDQLCGPMGMETIGQIIKEADQHPNIDAIVLQIDSPGGTIDGTETLANIVNSAKKPIVSFIDGQMCSAALWVGTSAHEVIASTDTDEVGSVGVLISFADMQPYWEKQGIRFHLVTASTSPDKVKLWEDLRAGKYDQYTTDILDPLDEKFMNVIRANCPNVKELHLTGKVFFARDVMDVFVNSIGTIEDAIQRASDIAREMKNSKSTYQRKLGTKSTEKTKAQNNDNVNWAIIDQLPHNKSVDQNNGLIGFSNAEKELIKNL